MIDRVVQINDKEVSILQDLSLSHAGTVWDGALIQIAYWNKNRQEAKSLLQSKRVLQLGSGTGVLGLAAACFNPQKMYLTDLPEYLKVLEVNHLKNKNIMDKQTQQNIQVLPLRWGNQQDINKIQKIDTIIGSQLAYDKKCILELMNTLKIYRQINPNLKIMIAFQKYKQPQRNIEQYFKQTFGQNSYKLVEKQKMDDDYQDDFIGIIYI